MLPDQQFDGIPSGNPMPPWTPQVWRDGPDGLVAQAQQMLFQNDQEMDQTLSASQGSVAMSGPTANPENETDQIIDPMTPGDSPSHGPSTSGRASYWNGMMQDMRRDEPLASWASGQKDGPANPAP
jgi:hypothetical protein